MSHLRRRAMRRITVGPLVLMKSCPVGGARVSTISSASSSSGRASRRNVSPPAILHFALAGLSRFPALLNRLLVAHDLDKRRGISRPRTPIHHSLSIVSHRHAIERGFPGSCNRHSALGPHMLSRSRQPIGRTPIFRACAPPADEPPYAPLRGIPFDWRRWPRGSIVSRGNQRSYSA